MCSINGNTLKNVDVLYGVIICQFDCEYELSMAITQVIECNDLEVGGLSTHCMLYFINGIKDEAIIRFHTPADSRISRITFLADNKIDSEGPLPKLDMWV